MTQIVALIHEEEGRYGASFPDLPGCTTVAGDPDTVLSKAAEVATFHLAALAEDDVELPTFRTLAELRDNPEFVEDANGAMIALVDIERPARTVRVNITLDEGTLRRIDRAARITGESRSGFLVSAAMARLRKAI